MTGTWPELPEEGVEYYLHLIKIPSHVCVESSYSWATYSLTNFFSFRYTVVRSYGEFYVRQSAASNVRVSCIKLTTTHNLVVEVLGWVYFIASMTFTLGTPTQWQRNKCNFIYSLSLCWCTKNERHACYSQFSLNMIYVCTLHSLLHKQIIPQLYLHTVMAS